MNKSENFLDINGHLLRMLVCILEKGSISKAAQELGVTQSAVSHALDKLREITHDPLFVKSGRGISPTARATELGNQAKSFLSQLQAFSDTPHFSPKDIDLTITIAANDLQRDLLLPSLFIKLREQAPKVKLKIISSGIPSLEMLRDQGCHFAISPRPPNGSDIIHKRLFEDQYVVFYDAKKRSAPKNISEFLEAEHISVVYDPPRPIALDEFLLEKNLRRNFAITVPSFSAIPAFLKDSTMLATLPSMVKVNLFKDFASANVPVKCPGMPMYLIWHQKYHKDPTQLWIRKLLIESLNVVPSI